MGAVPRRGAGRAVRIATLLAPAGLRLGKVVMAAEAAVVGEFRPGGTLRVSRQPFQCFAQLNRLAYGPQADVMIRIGSRLPVRRLNGAVRIELEDQIRM